jgi:hypothetical protein
LLDKYDQLAQFRNQRIDPVLDDIRDDFKVDLPIGMDQADDRDQTKS